MRGGQFKFKVGANREVEKLTTGMANYPASFLGGQIDAMGWCGMKFEIYGGEVAKDGRSGTDIFNLIVVQIKNANLTT